MTSRVQPIIVFDVNETLLDITTLEPLFQRVFGDAAVMREWFAQLVLYSQTLTLSGRYTPFGEIAAGVIRMVGETRNVAVGDDDVAELRRRIGSMPAHPDVAPALAKLRDAGFRLVTLTNSPPSAAPTPLDKAGIAEFFEASHSVDSVGRFKPAPETYRLVAEAHGVATGDLCLVACHVWDTIGAQAAGCYGALVTRPGNAVLHAPETPVPAIVATDLGAIADAIIQRFARQG